MVQYYDQEGDEIEGFSHPNDNLCEECCEESALYDAILYGKHMKLCDKCTKLCGALVIPKPTESQVYNSKRPSTRETMKRASGIEPKKADKILKTLTLEDMRERARILKEKKEKEKQAEREAKEKEESIFKKKGHDVLDEKKFIEYLEKEIEEIKEEENEKKEGA